MPPVDTASMPEVLRTDPISQPPPPVPPAEVVPAKPYTAGQIIDPSTYDAFRVPQGCKCEDGRITRQNKTPSGRPESSWPEILATMSAKDKREAKAAKMPSLASHTVAAHGTPVPCMPVILGKSKWPHCEKLQDDMKLHGFVLVERPVRPKEAKTNMKAIEAMQKEWDSLRELGAWNEKAVQE